MNKNCKFIAFTLLLSFVLSQFSFVAYGFEQEGNDLTLIDLFEEFSLIQDEFGDMSGDSSPDNSLEENSGLNSIDYGSVNWMYSLDFSYYITDEPEIMSTNLPDSNYIKEFLEKEKTSVNPIIEFPSYQQYDEIPDYLVNEDSFSVNSSIESFVYYDDSLLYLDLLDLNEDIDMFDFRDKGPDLNLSISEDDFVEIDEFVDFEDYDDSIAVESELLEYHSFHLSPTQLASFRLSLIPMTEEPRTLSINVTDYIPEGYEYVYDSFQIISEENIRIPVSFYVDYFEIILPNISSNVELVWEIKGFGNLAGFSPIIEGYSIDDDFNQLPIIPVAYSASRSENIMSRNGPSLRSFDTIVSTNMRWLDGDSQILDYTINNSLMRRDIALIEYYISSSDASTITFKMDRIPGSTISIGAGGAFEYAGVDSEYVYISSKPTADLQAGSMGTIAVQIDSNMNMLNIDEHGVFNMNDIRIHYHNGDYVITSHGNFYQFLGITLRTVKSMYNIVKSARRVQSVPSGYGMSGVGDYYWLAYNILYAETQTNSRHLTTAIITDVLPPGAELVSAYWGAERGKLTTSLYNATNPSNVSPGFVVESNPSGNKIIYTTTTNLTGSLQYVVRIPKAYPSAVDVTNYVQLDGIYRNDIAVTENLDNSSVTSRLVNFDFSYDGDIYSLSKWSNTDISLDSINPSLTNQDCKDIGFDWYLRVNKLEETDPVNIEVTDDYLFYLTTAGGYALLQDHQYYYTMLTLHNEETNGILADVFVRFEGDSHYTVLRQNINSSSASINLSNLVRPVVGWRVVYKNVTSGIYDTWSDFYARGYIRQNADIPVSQIVEIRNVAGLMVYSPDGTKLLNDLEQSYTGSMREYLITMDLVNYGHTFYRTTADIPIVSDYIQSYLMSTAIMLGNNSNTIRWGIEVGHSKAVVYPEINKFIVDITFPRGIMFEGSKDNILLNGLRLPADSTYYVENATTEMIFRDGSYRQNLKLEIIGPLVSWSSYTIIFDTFFPSYAILEDISGTTDSAILLKNDMTLTYPELEFTINNFSHFELSTVTPNGNISVDPVTRHKVHAVDLLNFLSSLDNMNSNVTKRAVYNVGDQVEYRDIIVRNNGSFYFVLNVYATDDMNSIVLHDSIPRVGDGRGTTRTLTWTGSSDIVVYRNGQSLVDPSNYTASTPVANNLQIAFTPSYSLSTGEFLKVYVKFSTPSLVGVAYNDFYYESSTTSGISNSSNRVTVGIQQLAVNMRVNVWEDVNDNGIRDLNEPVIVNAVVQLVKDGTPVDTVIRRTNSAGIVDLSLSSDGEYSILVTLPYNYARFSSVISYDLISNSGIGARNVVNEFGESVVSYVLDLDSITNPVLTISGFNAGVIPIPVANVTKTAQTSPVSASDSLIFEIRNFTNTNRFTVNNYVIEDIASKNVNLKRVTVPIFPYSTDFSAEVLIGDSWVWIGDYFGHVVNIIDYSSYNSQGFRLVFGTVLSNFGINSVITAEYEFNGRLTFGSTVTNVGKVSLSFGDITAEETSIAEIILSDVPVTSIVKTSEKEHVKLGDLISFTLSGIENKTDSVATNFVIVDEVPSGLKLRSLYIPPTVQTYSVYIGSDLISSSQFSDLSAYDGDLKIDFGEVPSGFNLGNVIVTFVAVEVGNHSNEAILSCIVFGEDIESRDSSEVFIYDYELSLNKSADITEAKVGDRVCYTIDIGYTGTTIAKDITITDTIPFGFSYSLDSSNYLDNLVIDKGKLIWSFDEISSPIRITYYLIIISGYDRIAINTVILDDPLLGELTDEESVRILPMEPLLPVIGMEPEQELSVKHGTLHHYYDNRDEFKDLYTHRSAAINTESNNTIYQFGDSNNHMEANMFDDSIMHIEYYFGELTSSNASVLAWSPNGLYVAIGFNSSVPSDIKFLIWDVHDSLVVFDSTELSNVQSISWSPNSDYVAVGYGVSGSGQDRFRVYNVWGSLVLSSSSGTISRSSVFSWSPDSVYLAVGYPSIIETDDKIRVYDVVAQSIELYDQGSQNVQDISWSSDGNYLAISYNSSVPGNNKVRVYNFPSKSVIWYNNDYTNASSLLWNSDNSVLFVTYSHSSGSLDHIRAYDNSGSVIWRDSGFINISNLIVSPDNSLLTITGFNGIYGTVNLATYSLNGNLLWSDFTGYFPNTLEWSKDNYLVVGYYTSLLNEDKVRVYDSKGNILWVQNTGRRNVSSVSWSTSIEANYLTVSYHTSESGEMRYEFYDVIPPWVIYYSDEYNAVFGEDANFIYQTQISSNKIVSHNIVGTDITIPQEFDTNMYTLDIEVKNIVWDVPISGIDKTVASPDGHYVAVARYGSFVRIYSVIGELLANFDLISSNVKLDWSKDSVLLSISSNDGNIRVYNRETGIISYQSSSIPGISSVSWSSDDETISVLSSNGLYVINAVLGSLNYHITTSHLFAEWSPDGNFLLSATSTAVVMYNKDSMMWTNSFSQTASPRAGSWCSDNDKFVVIYTYSTPGQNNVLLLNRSQSILGNDTLSRNASTVSWSSDGLYYAVGYETMSTGEHRVRVFNRDGIFQWSDSMNSRNASSLIWSPCNSQLYVSYLYNTGSEPAVEIYSSFGTVIISLAEQYEHVAWSPTGSFVALGRNTGNPGNKVVIYNMAGVLQGSSSVSRNVSSLKWSPDGSKLAVSYNTDSPIEASLNVFSTSGQILYSQNDIEITDIFWSPDGSYIGVSHKSVAIVDNLRMYALYSPFTSVTANSPLFMGSKDIGSYLYVDEAESIEIYPLNMFVGVSQIGLNNFWVSVMNFNGESILEVNIYINFYCTPKLHPTAARKGDINWNVYPDMLVLTESSVYAFLGYSDSGDGWDILRSATCENPKVSIGTHTISLEKSLREESNHTFHDGSKYYLVGEIVRYDLDLSVKATFYPYPRESYYRMYLDSDFPWRSMWYNYSFYHLTDRLDSGFTGTGIVNTGQNMDWFKGNGYFLRMSPHIMDGPSAIPYTFSFSNNTSSMKYGISGTIRPLSPDVYESHIPNSFNMVFYSGFDSSIPNNYASNEIWVTVRAPQLDILKYSNPESDSNDPTSVIANGINKISYFVDITNIGNIPTNGVTVTDIVPTYTSLVAGSISHGGTAPDNRNISWSIPDIPYGETITLSFDVTVNLLTEQQLPSTSFIRNIALVNGNPTNEVVHEIVPRAGPIQFDMRKYLVDDLGDSIEIIYDSIRLLTSGTFRKYSLVNGDNPVATIIVPENEDPDMYIANNKDKIRPLYEVGDVYKYRIDVTNIDSIDHTDVNISDFLQMDLDFISSSVTPLSANSNHLNWSMDLVSGETKSIIIEVRVISIPNSLIISNVALLTHIPTNIYNYEAKSEDVEVKEKALSTFKYGSKYSGKMSNPNYVRGDIVEYTISLRNSSPDTLNDIWLEDELNGVFSIQDDSLSPTISRQFDSDISLSTVVVEGNIVKFYIPEIKSGDTIILKIWVKIIEFAPQGDTFVVPNYGTYYIGFAEFPENEDGDTTNIWDIIVEEEARISLIKTSRIVSSGNILPVNKNIALIGEFIRYTIELDTNESIKEAINVVLRDLLPFNGLYLDLIPSTIQVFIDDSLTTIPTESALIDEETVIWWELGNISPNTEIKIVFDMLVIGTSVTVQSTIP